VQRVKMADVARRAGVSVATVSKVVNGRYGVAQATIDRIIGAPAPRFANVIDTD
jgi:LacI family transcriptional regulator